MVDINIAEEPTLAVAESDPTVRDSIAKALRVDFKSILVAPAGSGKSSLLLNQYLARQPADLIIYDLKLGIGNLKSLRDQHPDVLVLVIAAQKPTATLSQALKLGVIDFVTEPVQPEELRIRVRRCLTFKKWPLPGPDTLAHGMPSAKLRGISASPRPGHPEHPKGLAVSLQKLHSPSGRLNASAIAKLLDVPLSDMASALRINYTALHKTPDSQSVQKPLDSFKRILVILTDMLGKQETVRAWLNTSHPDLGRRTPISVMLEGHADAVLTILENALAGVPS